MPAHAQLPMHRFGRDASPALIERLGRTARKLQQLKSRLEEPRAAVRMSPWHHLVPIGGSTEPAYRPTLEHRVMIVWSLAAYSGVGTVERLKRPVALVLPASTARP